MSTNKPKDISEYKKWLKDKHSVEIEVRTQTYYDSVANKIRNDFINTLLWQSLSQQIVQIGQEYYLKTKYYLLTDDQMPEIVLKPFDSFLLKTFRHNIINNNKWPDEPQNGWILPNNWFIKIKDIVRTCFVVKYLDGINFFLDKLKLLCQENALNCKIDFEAKEEGYYAAHAYVSFQSEIPKQNWDTEKVDSVIELQVTTQLQEVIRKLLHKYYEVRRKNVPSDGIKWQWDYRSDEFSANYLGHILHYVEGMIMDVRDKQEEKK
jgi:hypothetical protein